MRSSIALLSLLLVLAVSDRALAVKILANISRENIAESGFKVSVKEDKQGMLLWTIERELSKARSFPADSELTVRRTATVRLYDKAGLAAEFSPEPRSAGKGRRVLSYRFKTSRAMAKHAHLTVAEIDDYKDPDRFPLLGGGTFFELPLHALVELPAAADKEPQTPVPQPPD